MAGILDPGDSHLPSRKLNAVNDPSPGNIVSTANVSGSIIQPYTGQLGKRLVCTPNMANTLSDTSVGQLYEGIYQYVKVAAGTTIVRGQLAYWADGDSYGYSTAPTNPTFSVTNVPLPAWTKPAAGGATLAIPIAGVFLSAPTAGNYCYIQISGKASLLFVATIQNGNGGIFRVVTADGVTSARGDIMNAASPVNFNLAQLILGITLNTPSNNAIGLVDLYTTRQVYGGFGGF